MLDLTSKQDGFDGGLLICFPPVNFVAEMLRIQIIAMTLVSTMLFLPIEIMCKTTKKTIQILIKFKCH